MKFAFTYTTAPPSYDGFGTTTLRTLDGDRRLVVTPADHADWQRQRYGSGGYPTDAWEPTASDLSQLALEAAVTVLREVCDEDCWPLAEAALAIALAATENRQQ